MSKITCISYVGGGAEGGAYVCCVFRSLFDSYLLSCFLSIFFLPFFFLFFFPFLFCFLKGSLSKSNTVSLSMWRLQSPAPWSGLSIPLTHLLVV